MGEAGEMMNRMTDRFFSGDYDGAGMCYAEDAIAESPDLGEMKGRDEIVNYMKTFFGAFPDAKYEAKAMYEDGDTAIDEGIFSGTNSGPFPTPDGGEIPATGQRVSIRGCDVVTVKDGMITRHSFYFDQTGMLQQLV